jgi:D-alanine-D-alanine ligase
MRIGLTYDLRDDYLKLGFDDQQVAEFDRADTIASLEKALRMLGHRPDRIGRVQVLIDRLAKGERWDLVFNIAEGLSAAGIGRESQVPLLLDLHGIPYTFSDPLVCALTLQKAVCKLAVRGLGLPTPAFAVVSSQADIARVRLPYPLFAKPIAEGSSKGVFGNSKVRNPEELAIVCCGLLERFRQPVLVETFLPGREFTVGMVGTGERAEAIAAMEVHLLPHAEAEVYSYANKENCEELVNYTLAEGPIRDEAFALALAVWRGLGCRDGGRVDVRADASGRLSFIEVNVLPGLHPEHSDLPILSTMSGLGYPELIARILESALERAPQRIREVKPLRARKASKNAGAQPRRRPAKRTRGRAADRRKTRARR